MDRPSLTHKAGTHEVRWTYGLQLDLQRMIPDASQAIAVMMTDPYVRDYLLRRSLTDVKKTVTDEDEFIKVEDIDLDPDEILALMDWLVGHLLYFFGKSAGLMTRRGEQVKGSLPQIQLEPLIAGSPASASAMPSAGPSESSKES